MKKTILAALLSATLLTGFGRYRDPADSAAAARTATTDSVAPKPPAPATAAATRGKDSAATRTNTDSLTIVKSLEQQRKMGVALYNRKLDSFIPAALASLVLVAGLGIFLLQTTSLCRDQSVDPKTNKLRPVNERPYSYARVQLFWWTMIIFWCLTAFYIYTGILLALTPTAVLLLGGGLAVSVFGNVMDNAQRAQNNIPVPVRHQDITAKSNLLTDILSDEGGISIHRLQAVLANIIFGLAFLSNFMRALDIAYPLTEFESWQMTLLGASAAGYLGFKANENSRATITERQVEAVADLPDPAAPQREGIALQQTPSAPPATPAIHQLKASLREQGLI